MKLRLLIFFSCIFLKSFGSVTDTIHVSHYNISLDTINYPAQTINGMTELTVHAKLNNVNNISLGLYILIVDSITSGGAQLTYFYNDTTLFITPPAVMNTNDSLTLQVYYHGHPKTDASWGGFYFSGQYAFNIGVGFSANPHTFGKVWFPCVDEFTDRSTYEFHVRTRSSHKAFCNGVLTSSVTNPDSTITWNWMLNQPIASYLAAIAVAPFYTIHRNYQGIPVELGVLPGDSAKSLIFFQHLDSAILNDINGWGPYPWDKVGYVMVPFNAGAMEHATSIHVGSSFIDTSLTYEAAIMAHELSHMWFGDLVTCTTEQDMWLNEGWANYNENYFTEFVYGSQAYEINRRHQHRQVLMYIPIQDGGYFALNNVPHNKTYGNTVYVKGGDVVHSIRRFMGDSLFFPAVRSYLSNRAFTNVSSDDLRFELESSSGIPMTDYFSTMIGMQGYPFVGIDSFTVVPNGGNYDVSVYTREKMKGNNQSFTLPVEINFTSADNDTVIQTTVNAFTNSFMFTIPFEPGWVGVDRADKLADATLDYTTQVTDTGTYNFPETYCSINVLTSGSDTSQVRITNNLVTPDPFLLNTDFIRLSDYHYYTVEGIFAPGFHAKGSFGYDGTANFLTGYLDNTLFTSGAREDSLILLYRQHAGMNWEPVNGYTINFNGTHLDKKGWLVVDTLKQGEYVFGMHDINTVTQSVNKMKSSLSISPNPVIDHCTINFTVPVYKNSVITITDMKGNTVFKTPVFSYQEKIEWDAYYAVNGTYVVTLLTNNKVVGTQKVVVKK
jgi:hypothetical protein